MFDGALRPLKDTLFNPLSRSIPSAITPTQITLLAFLSGLLSCLSAARQNISLSLLFWAVNRFLDCLDGAVARHRRAQSDVGGFLDLLGDFVINALVPIACALGSGVQGEDLLSVALLEASFFLNNFVLFYVAAVVEKRRADQLWEESKELTSVVMRPALIEGVESGVLFTLMLMFPEHLQMLSYVMVGGLVIGMGQRVVWVVPTMKTSRPEKSSE